MNKNVDGRALLGELIGHVPHVVTCSDVPVTVCRSVNDLGCVL